MRRTAGATVAAVALTAGCGGGLTNAEWVAEPEAGAVAASTPESLALDDGAGRLVDDTASFPGPHRLDHTVTLGAVVDVPRDGAPAPAPPPAPPTIVINVNNYGAPGGYGYAAVPVVSARSAAITTAPLHASRTSGTEPGRSWPAPASYGPAFPFNTSPASPWEHKR